MQFFVKSTSRPVAHFSLDERRKDGWLVVCGKLVRSSKNNGLVCKFLYYLASSISGQDESNPALLERARWSYLVSPGLPAVCRKKKFSKSHIKNPLLIKLVGQDGLILTSFMDSVLVHEHVNWKRTWSISSHLELKLSQKLKFIFYLLHIQTQFFQTLSIVWITFCEKWSDRFLFFGLKPEQQDECDDIFVASCKMTGLTNQGVSYNTKILYQWIAN